MKELLFLGIDTSNYTTSVAMADEKGQVICNLRRLLPVAEGMCGLRQSDALFAHTKALPSMMEEVQKLLDGRRPCAVGVSTRPRNREGSYMPCFLAGVASARTAAAVLGVPFYTFSHQCGHLRAAVYSSGKEGLLQRPFGAFHISGGTTEMLYVCPGENGFSAKIVGGSRDLSAGQLIDRVGVKFGLSFPAGKELEAMATGFTGKTPHRKVKTDKGYVHLSGVENMVADLYEKTNDRVMCAAFAIEYLAEAVCAMSRDLRTAYGQTLPIVYAGGVMSDQLIRQKVEKEIPCAYFAEPCFSTDNAAGIALLTRDAFMASK